MQEMWGKHLNIYTKRSVLCNLGHSLKKTNLLKPYMIMERTDDAHIFFFLISSLRERGINTKNLLKFVVPGFFFIKALQVTLNIKEHFLT